MPVSKQQALDYHNGPRPGKIEVTPTKPCRTQRDLSLAYTPGVAEPCLEIEKNPQDAFKYTGKGNLVAVLSNGTAVLGLGDIGALAGKPVMEGKAVLFKRFADVDVFDIEVNSHDPEEIIKLCQLLEPTFGGINLEDIKAPDCFRIEEELRRDDEDSRVSRRSARHRDHLGCSPAECSGSCGQRHGQDPGGLQRSRSSRHCLRRALRTAGSEAGEHPPLRHQGSGVQGPQRGNEQIQGAFCPGHATPHLGRSDGRGRCVCRPIGEGCDYARDGLLHGTGPHRFCHGESRS